MAKSKTKELERLKKLYKDGDVSRDEYEEMRDEIMRSKGKKSEDDGSGCLGFLILVGIGYAIYAFL